MSYILSIVGVVFLGVMVDIICPEGKMNSFIKSIFSLVLLFVIISPAVDLISNNSLTKLFNSNYSLDEEYLNSVNEMKVNNFEIQIINTLEKQGITGVDVEIEGNMLNEEIEVKKVTVNTQKMVLTSGDKHINKYEVITKLIENILGVKSEVIIYE